MTNFISLKSIVGQYLSPFLLHKALSVKIGELKSVKHMGPGHFVLQSKDEEQAKKLLTIKHIGEIEVSVTLDGARNTSIGIIKARCLIHLNDEFILSELANQKVIAVERILRRGRPKEFEAVVKEGFCATGLFKLTFGSADRPGKIRVGYEQYVVETYYPQPQHCNSCHSWGHISRSCSKIVCGNCGLNDHQTNECNATENKCPNCSGNHQAWDKSCKKYIDEKQIIKYQIDNNVSMKEARKHFKKPKTTQNTYAEITQTAPKPNGNDTAVQLEVVLQKFTLFCDQQTTFMNQAMTLLTEMMGMMRSIQAGFCHPPAAQSSKAVDIQDIRNTKDDNRFGGAEEATYNTTQDSSGQLREKKQKKGSAAQKSSSVTQGIKNVPKSNIPNLRSSKNTAPLKHK